MHPIVSEYLNGSVPTPPNNFNNGNAGRKLKNDKVDKNGVPIQMRSVSETKSS